jgi:hypothetical protein
LAGHLAGQTAVQPSGSIVAGQVDVASLNGITTATGNGVTNTGTLRVTLSNDSTGRVSVASVSATGAAVPGSADYNGLSVAGILTGQTAVVPSAGVVAGQADLASVAGTTTAAGNGATNAGTLRVTLSNDSTGQVKLAASGGTNIGNVGGLETAGAAPTGLGVRMMGSDGALARDILTNAAGAVVVSTVGQVATYSVSVGFNQTASGVVFQLQGSNTKTIRIKRVTVTATETTAATGSIQLFVTTTTSTGTQTAQTASPFDTNDAAATAAAATIATPTGNGTIIGRFGQQYFFASSPTAQGTVYLFTTPPGGKDITLRGTGQYLGVQVFLPSFTGEQTDIDVEWTEE